MFYIVISQDSHTEIKKGMRFYIIAGEKTDYEKMHKFSLKLFERGDEYGFITTGCE